MNKSYFLALFLIVSTTGCKLKENPNKESIDDVALAYIKLCLKIGVHDEIFIDAYYGPDKWKPKEVNANHFPYEELKWESNDLIHRLELVDSKSCSKDLNLRKNFLEKQLIAVSTRLDIMSGKNLPFNNEASNLYDISPPNTQLEEFDPLISKIEKLLPGSVPLNERYLAYSSQFVIPTDKLDNVFTTAINEAKVRVSKHIDLPPKEHFELNYVTNKPWSGYNWYQGNYYSLIQINTDLPIYIDRAIDLACHEGYPGHHVFNVLLEKHLVKENGWKEMMVYPLFSPQSFIAEGSANYGIEMAFPDEERLEYEKKVLFPLAGIDTELAEKYYKIQAIRKQLNFAEITIAHEFLQGSMSSDEVRAQLMKYLLFSKERAQQRLDFYDTYRSYIINYSLGEQKIESFVNSFGTTTEQKWKAFYQLLSSPKTASIL